MNSSLPFDEVFRDESGGNIKTLQAEYLREGKIPIVDQGKELIGGYTEDKSRLCKAELPVIVFGDHTKCLKFIDFPFALGADGVKVLRPKINANPKYLYYVLKSLRITDAGYSRHFKFLRRNEIPLPPLEHQRRIAEVIDRADTLRQRRLLAIQKLNTLLRSVFLDMFGDPVTNPKGWPTSNLESFGEFIGGGTPRRDVQSFYTGSICWATSKDMKGRVLTDTQEHITEQAIKKSATKLVPKETILIVVKSKILMRYLPVLVAKVPVCFGQDLKGLVLHDKSLVSFISHSIIFGQRTLLQQARGINTEGLTLDHLRPFQIMMPPDELVSTFTKIATKITDSIIRFESQLERSNNLFASLQHRAFKGELFPEEN